MFKLSPHITFFYPLIRLLAFDISDLLAEFGGLMGLLAGISVFSIIELVVNIFKYLWTAACRSKITPQAAQRPRMRKKFLVNRDHLFYYFGKTFADLLKESKVHGVHYTSAKRHKNVERIFWIIVICTLLTFCSVLVFNSLKDLQSNSVIIAIDEKMWSVEDVRFFSRNGLMISTKNIFQIPFPVISFCPDLNINDLYYHYRCLIRRICENVDHQALTTMLTTIHAGCEICDASGASWIEYYFYLELEKFNYDNISFAERLEYYLNPKWAEENSFCMDGGLSTRPNEVFVQKAGICFILNAKENIYSSR